MTLTELVFTVRGRENVNPFDAALFEDAARAAPAVSADGIMMDRDLTPVFDVVHQLAVKHWAELRDAEAELNRVDAFHKNLADSDIYDVSGVACDRWTPELIAAYYLGLAVGHRLARRLRE